MRPSETLTHYQTITSQSQLSENTLTLLPILWQETPPSHTHAQAKVAASGAALKYKFILPHDSQVKPLKTQLLLWQHLSSYHAYFIV